MSTLTATTASSLPHEQAIDSTLSLLREGYLFISNHCRKHRSDIFRTRLMFHKVTCALGEDAARMFYHPDRFTRVGAMPVTTLKMLQGSGSVSTLDGDVHRHRKRMFLSQFTPEAIQRLAELMVEHWQRQLGVWERARRVTLHDAVEGILCRAACEWAGVPLRESEVSVRTREFAAMIDGSGSVGPRAWRGLLLRRRNERWVEAIIEKIRIGDLRVPEGAAHAIAWHRDLNGNLLDTKVATVELINILRPVVAVAKYVTFAALALHQYQTCRNQIRTGGAEYREWFGQEVRRFYPFFPFVGRRALEAFEWRGHRFEKGAWVLFDLYGTNHDPRIWEEPEAFRPERFAQEGRNPFHLVPQGGGDYATNHRCPGEPATVEILKAAVQFLTERIHYQVPNQDLRIDLARMPAIPASRFIITNVHR